MSGSQMFVFPHAGAVSRAYRHWTDLPGYSTTVLDRPRRGPGLPGADAPTDAGRVVAASAARIGETLSESSPRHWVVFGHSFGALLAFATVRHLEREVGIRPSLMVLSASAAPAFQPADDTVVRLSDAELDAHIMSIGHTRAELLSGPTGVILRRYFREDQVLRAAISRDLTGSRVHVPILALAAEDDPHVEPHHVDAWRGHTSARAASAVIEGGHFAASQTPEFVTAAIDEWWESA